MMSTEKQACHDEEAQADTLKKEMKIKDGGLGGGGGGGGRLRSKHSKATQL